MKNILYICPFTFIGGGEKSLLVILKNLDRKRLRPFLICYSDGPFIKKAEESGLKVFIFNYNNLISNIFVIWNIFRFIGKNNIHIVHINSLDIRASIASWFAGVPCIGHLRVMFPFTWRDHLFVKLSKKTIAVSNAVIDTFCRKFPDSRDKFEIIPNAVEIPGNIVPAQLRNEFGLQGDTKLVGAAGRIYPLKGYEYFIESMASVKKEIENVYFFIIGGVDNENKDEKEYYERLKKRILELNLEKYCCFTGFREDILSVIASLDILVVPTIEVRGSNEIITEGFGRVAIEGMAVGVPVIASNAGGLKEIIEDRVSGLLVEPKNADDIGAAVKNILNDNELRMSIVRNGKECVQKYYTVDEHLSKVMKLYMKIFPEEDR